MHICTLYSVHQTQKYDQDVHEDYSIHSSMMKLLQNNSDSNEFK